MSIKAKIKNHALREKPLECCGLILNIANDLDTFPCKNCSSEPNDYFLINEKDYLKASLKGKIIASYHSQESNDFSELDKINSEGLNLKSIMFSWAANEFKEYIPNNYKNPYIGRLFQWEVAECFDLVRDYYLNELNIKINNYKRDKNWYNNSKDLFGENYEKEGFIKVDRPRKSDIILFKYHDVSYPTHVGILIDTNLVLHHPIHHFSCIEPYNRFLKEKTLYFLRHKSLC